MIWIDLKAGARFALKLLLQEKLLIAKVIRYLISECLLFSARQRDVTIHQYDKAFLQTKESARVKIHWTV